MSLKLLYSLLPAGLFLLVGYPTIAQNPDGIGAPSIEEGTPSDSMELESVPVEPAPVEPAPVEPEPSVDSEISPDSPAVSEPNSAPVGGVEIGPDEPHTLVQCGPGGAAYVVTEVPAGCRVLGVNSPPGQRMNSDSP
jgi:hypothetical protein